jgi:hypothetical protein
MTLSFLSNFLCCLHPGIASLLHNSTDKVLSKIFCLLMCSLAWIDAASVVNLIFFKHSLLNDLTLKKLHKQVPPLRADSLLVVALIRPNRSWRS